MTTVEAPAINFREVIQKLIYAQPDKVDYNEVADQLVDYAESQGALLEFSKLASKTYVRQFVETSRINSFVSQEAVLSTTGFNTEESEDSANVIKPKHYSNVGSLVQKIQAGSTLREVLSKNNLEKTWESATPGIQKKFVAFELEDALHQAERAAADATNALRREKSWRALSNSLVSQGVKCFGDLEVTDTVLEAVKSL